MTDARVMAATVAGACAYAFFFTLRQAGMTRRDAVRLTAAWISTAEQQQAFLPVNQAIVHGPN